MTQVNYDGPQPERDLVLSDGSVLQIKVGEPFDIPADDAKKLCEQEYFSRGAKAPKKRSRKRADKAPEASQPPAEESVEKPAEESQEVADEAAAAADASTEEEH